MGINIGNSSISNLRIGSSPVQRVYVGNDQVWPMGYSLENSLRNALISDRSNNITRTQNITILTHNTTSNYIEVEATAFMGGFGASAPKSWMICQGTEASTIVEVTSVELIPGVPDRHRVFYGTTYNGTPNFNVGQKVEFLNPFINYSLVPSDRPLFSPYPTTAGGSTFNYMHPGGVFQRANGTYVMMVNVVRGAHTSRQVYYATSSDCENWTFQNTEILNTSSIPFAKTNGNVFTTGNPYKMPNGEWLFLLAVEKPDGNYTGGYFVVNDSLSVITNPQQTSYAGNSNYFPMSITYYNGRYRVFYHNRSDNVDINKSSTEETYQVAESEANVTQILNGGISLTSRITIYDANLDSGYLNGKVDDIAYINDGNDLYIILGGEEEPTSGWVTSNNREYGIAKLSGQTTWINDPRSPMIVTPMQFYRKYPALDFFWDHIGGQMSPIVRNGHLYIFFAAGSDSPDYYMAGAKIPLNN